MTVDLRGVTVVLLAGTGSDDDYVYRAFATALHDVGATVVTPEPRPDRLIAGYVEDLDNAGRSGTIAVGGVSIGAAVAATWALAHPARAVAVLAALPAWTGAPEHAPAALMAKNSAHLLRRDGLAATISQMRASSPETAMEFSTLSQDGQWPALPDAMDEAAAYVAPTSADFERLGVPMGVAAATDDPVHPVEVAFEWVSAAPRAALQTVTLDAMGVDPAVLGTACVTALLEASG